MLAYHSIHKFSIIPVFFYYHSILTYLSMDFSRAFHISVTMMYQLILGILWDFFKQLWSKAVDRTAEGALSNINTIKSFDLTFEALLKDFQSLRCLASDVREQVKYAELSCRKKKKQEVGEWLEQVESIEEEVEEPKNRVETEGFIAILDDGGNVAKLNRLVSKLAAQVREFGELVLDDRGASGETFLTNVMIGQAFHDNLERILEALDSRNVSSIGVYGECGAGKTTLAKHVNNRLVQRSQGRVFWVTVSREFTIASLQGKISRLLGLDLSNEDEEGMRAARLHRVLSNAKDLVLILDDVWENIDMRKVGWSAECCRLIITTRSSDVCRRLRCRELVHVEKLDEDEAWKLFDVTLGIGNGVGSRVEEVAKAVAELCGGLPGEIISVAESMRGETSISRWRNCLEEMKERGREQDGMGR